MNLRLSVPNSDHQGSSVASTIQLVLATIVLFWSGFFTTDFLFSGVYTWPRSSRALTLTLAVIILTYEFVYKEQRAQSMAFSNTRHLKLVFYCCVLPYMLGSLALLTLGSLG